MRLHGIQWSSIQLRLFCNNLQLWDWSPLQRCDVGIREEWIGFSLQLSSVCACNVGCSGKHHINQTQHLFVWLILPYVETSRMEESNLFVVVAQLILLINCCWMIFIIYSLEKVEIYVRNMWLFRRSYLSFVLLTINSFKY